MEINTKGVLIDLDGTLLDTAPDIHSVINEIRTAHGLPLIPVETVRPLVSLGSSAILEAVYRDDFTPAQKVQFRTELLQRYHEQKTPRTVFFPGMKDFINRLITQGIPWGIVTNRTMALAEKATAQYPILNQAGCIVCADTTARQKPHPDPLLHACDKLSIKPEQALYIGDAEIDVQAGRAAGIRTLLVLFGYADPVEAAQWGAETLCNDAASLWAWMHKNDFFAAQTILPTTDLSFSTEA